MGLLITFWVLLALGFVFCFVGRFPGQILAFAALLIGYFGTDVIKYPDWVVIVSAILVVVSLYIGWKIAPKLGKKVHDYGKASKWGTFVGSLIALLCASSDATLSIIMLFVLPFAFAFLFEWFAKKDLAEAAKRPCGGYVVFLASTLLNLLVCVFCMLGAVGYFN